MQVKVNRKDMIADIEKELKEYGVEFQKTIELYKKKLAEYSKYIEKQVQKNNADGVKSPPYPPSSRKEEFEESVEMLKAHVEETIKMEDHEFKSLKSGIKDLHVSNTSTTMALNSISY